MLAYLKRTNPFTNGQQQPRPRHRVGAQFEASIKTVDDKVLADLADIDFKMRLGGVIG